MSKIFLLLFFCCCGCSIFHSKNKNLKGIKVKETVPILNQQAKLLGYDSAAVEIYYLGDAHMYRLKYRFDSSYNDTHVLTEEREHYVYYKKGSNYGYDYNEKKIPSIRKISMDSLRKLEWIFRIDVYNIFTKAKTTLVSSRKDLKNGVLQEHYNYIGLQDTSMTGSCQLVFTNKIKDIEFSLCKELDSLKGMKLQQINIVRNPRYYKAAGIHLERTEVSYSLEEIIPEQKMHKYFEMFEKENKDF